MKRNKFILWLFVLPLALPLVQCIKSYAPPKITIHNLGGFKSTVDGERAAMKKLAALTQSGQDQGRVGVGWNVSYGDPSDPKAKVSIDLLALEYERAQKRFVKYDEVGTKEHPWRSIVTQYTHVEPSAIRRVAAANGVASDLLKHGAKLKRHGPIDRDAERKLVLQW